MYTSKVPKLSAPQLPANYRFVVSHHKRGLAVHLEKSYLFGLIWIEQNCYLCVDTPQEVHEKMHRLKREKFPTHSTSPLVGIYPPRRTL